jgi:dienelactone hydrolase
MPYMIMWGKELGKRDRAGWMLALLRPNHYCHRMPARRIETIAIPTEDGFAVRGDLYLPVPGEIAGIVVLCHGFKGYRTWGFFPFLAGRLAGAAVAALAIDFCLDGDLGGVARPDLFRRDTIRREIADLETVLSAIARNGLGGRVDRRKPLGLFGHSRGAVAATLAACDDEGVGALCTWSCPVHPDHFTPAQKERWRRKGEYDFTDTRDGARLALGIDYLDDLEASRDDYDLVRRVAGLRAPHLIVHGELDLAVGVGSARALYDAETSSDDKRLVIVRTGHTFGVTGDLDASSTDTPRALIEASDVTVDWFTRHFGKGT